ADIIPAIRASADVKRGQLIRIASFLWEASPDRTRGRMTVGLDPRVLSAEEHARIRRTSSKGGEFFLLRDVAGLPLSLPGSEEGPLAMTPGVVRDFVEEGARKTYRSGNLLWKREWRLRALARMVVWAVQVKAVTEQARLFLGPRRGGYDWAAFVARHPAEDAVDLEVLRPRLDPAVSPSLTFRASVRSHIENNRLWLKRRLGIPLAMGTFPAAGAGAVRGQMPFVLAGAALALAFIGAGALIFFSFPGVWAWFLARATAPLSLSRKIFIGGILIIGGVLASSRAFRVGAFSKVRDFYERIARERGIDLKAVAIYLEVDALFFTLNRAVDLLIRGVGTAVIINTSLLVSGRIVPLALVLAFFSYLLVGGLVRVVSLAIWNTRRTDVRLRQMMWVVWAPFVGSLVPLIIVFGQKGLWHLLRRMQALLRSPSDPARVRSEHKMPSREEVDRHVRTLGDLMDAIRFPRVDPGFLTEVLAGMKGVRHAPYKNIFVGLMVDQRVCYVPARGVFQDIDATAFVDDAGRSWILLAEDLKDRDRSETLRSLVHEVAVLHGDPHEEARKLELLFLPKILCMTSASRLTSAQAEAIVPSLNTRPALESEIRGLRRGLEIAEGIVRSLAQDRVSGALLVQGLLEGTVRFTGSGDVEIAVLPTPDGEIPGLILNETCQKTLMQIIIAHLRLILGCANMPAGKIEDFIEENIVNIVHACAVYVGCYHTLDDKTVYYVDKEGVSIDSGEPIAWIERRLSASLQGAVIEEPVYFCFCDVGE
ncbi:MAG: hypothetical protein GX606_04755, partial [Elusimicrobia bacterium]|nr:hypothetical protein [Elusimicrobiota bacterium]